MLPHNIYVDSIESCKSTLNELRIMYISGKFSIKLKYAYDSSLFMTKLMNKKIRPR